MGFAANSLVLKKNISNYIRQTCAVVMSPKKDERHFMIVKPLHIPQAFFRKFVNELKKVVDRVESQPG